MDPAALQPWRTSKAHTHVPRLLAAPSSELRKHQTVVGEGSAGEVFGVRETSYSGKVSSDRFGQGACRYLRRVIAGKGSCEGRRTTFKLVMRRSVTFAETKQHTDARHRHRHRHRRRYPRALSHSHDGARNRWEEIGRRGREEEKRVSVRVLDRLLG